MLRIDAGQTKPLCNGVSRRRFLEVGSLGVFGLNLSSLLRSEARGADAAGHAQRHSSKRSVILIWQHGGPSQLDTFDMKPYAPEEVRGPYQSIASSLQGLDVCELCPEQAKVMHLCTTIRSFTHGNSDHWAAAHWMLTGRLGANGSNRAPRQPSMSAIASHLLGSRLPGVLPTVNMNDGGFGYHGGAWLGVAHNPFRYGEFSYGNEAGRAVGGDHQSFTLSQGLTTDILRDRVELQQQFDTLRRRMDGNRTFAQIDDVDRQALDILMTGKTREAFDVSHESEATRARYGDGWGEQALVARRLIEAGARFVTLNTGYWDDHGKIKRQLDKKMPKHDRAVGVLLQDLHERGMLEDTLVVTAGEFGRTPVMNKDAGRDHWPQTQSILIAGGGYRHGQVIGSTDAKAAYVESRPVSVEDFCAIFYHALGLNVHETVVDPTGRPMHLLPHGEVPREMV
jgi:hypothetical protein